MKDKNIVNIVFFVFFLAGAIFHVVPYTLDMVKMLTPFTLIISAGFVLYHPMKNRKFQIWFFPTLIITFFLEALGVETGLVFGAYNYGATLGFKLFEVPVIIALNWVCVVFGAVVISDYYIKNKFIAALLSAILSTGVDYIMEPSAIFLDYWTWDGGDIPLLNYTAWFVISLTASIFYLFIKPEVRTDRATLMFKLQVIFFAIITTSLIFR
jgi:putative membrane protein